MMDFFGNIFGVVIRFFCQICGNQYWLGIFVFTLAINLLMLPLNIKQQKTTAMQARMRNRLAKIKEKCGNDRAKYQEEMSKVYSESGSSPFGGCLLMLIRLPIFFAIYSAVRRPITSILGIGTAAQIDAAAANFGIAANSYTKEIEVLQKIGETGQYAELQGDINFNLFGINLFEQPELGTPAWIWLIPILSFATSMLMSLYTTMNNKKTNPDAAGAGMGCMMFGMPIFSLVLTFGYPGAVGWYWACSNIVSTMISVAMTKLYSPGKLIAQTEAKEALKRRAYEQNIMNPQPQTGKKPIVKK